MVFKYCKKCIAIRQFLPNGYPVDDNGNSIPRHCDICGSEG